MAAPVRRRRRHHDGNNSNTNSSEHDISKKGIKHIISKSEEDARQQMKTGRHFPLYPSIAAIVAVIIVAIVVLWQRSATVFSSSETNTVVKEGFGASSRVSNVNIDPEIILATTNDSPLQPNSAHTRQQTSTTTDEHGITQMGEDYQLLETLPHDSTAFTQGLVYMDGIMYEGTGLHGMSELRRVDVRTGKVLQRHVMDRQYFGEGIAYYTIKSTNQTRLLQLTWQEGQAFVYEAETFQVLQQFSFTTTTKEGWGIAYNSHTHEFIVSDGSEWLHIWDATTMQQVRKVKTTMNIKGGQQQLDQNNHEKIHTIPVQHLNELEFDIHDGTVLANVWYRDIILRIDVNTGHVLRVYDFSKLHTDRQPGEDCFNGIAIVTDKPGELYVTGKKWPVMYHVKLLL